MYDIGVKPPRLIGISVTSIMSTLVPGVTAVTVDVATVTGSVEVDVVVVVMVGYLHFSIDQREPAVGPTVRVVTTKSWSVVVLRTVAVESTDVVVV